MPAGGSDFDRVFDMLLTLDLARIEISALLDRGVRQSDYRDLIGVTPPGTHYEIAVLFRMPSSNSVAQTIRRTKAQYAQTLKVLKHQMSHK